MASAIRHLAVRSCAQRHPLRHEANTFDHEIRHRAQSPILQGENGHWPRWGSQIDRERLDRRELRIEHAKHASGNHRQIVATVWANDLGQIVMLRYLTGVGLGGLMPNLICLNAELAPRRLRATLVTVMFAGISLGGGIPGYVQAWLIPQYGWRIMFWIGGLAPLALAACLMFTLPESVRYLMGWPHRRTELLATVRRLRRDLNISDAAQFVATVTPQVGSFALRQIFRGGLAWMTPLLWVCFASALMTNFFLNSWLPLIFADSGLVPRQGGVATSLYHYSGLIGGVLVSLALARFGFAVIALLFLLAVPAIAAIGLANATYITMAMTTGLAGFCVLGAQFGNIAAAGLLYPTESRSLGVGWALAFGRVGSIAGPLLGGLLIDAKLPLQRLFLLAAVPMATGLIAASSIVGLSYWRVGRLHFDGLHSCIDLERPASAAVARRVG
jgi:AAHS family 4-hydroxybenzoate transporter-like MFS transporter